MNESMQTKVVLITGATAGIGKQTAIGLAQQGAQVIIVGRNAERGAEAVSEIKAASNSTSVEFIPADLSLLKSVRELAKTFQDRYPRLDVLINNIGASFGQCQETSEGFERTFAINYLAPFLLTTLLLPTMKNSTPARIVNVSSRAHRLFGPLDFNDLESKKNFLGMRAYGQAKLAKLLFTYELARQLEGAGITVNAVDPGNADTEGMRSLSAEQLPWFLRLFFPLMGLTQRYVARFATAEKAAKSSIYLASSPEVANVTGKHFDAAMKMTNSAKPSYDEAAGKRLWDVSIALCNRGIN
jgi:retinol dehydrogenase 12